MERPQCSSLDATSAGYDMMPCSNPAVALFRMEGIETDAPLCLDCLMRRVRVAVDLKGYVLTVVAGPMPSESVSDLAPAPSEPIVP